MKLHVQIVSQLLQVNVWNKRNLKMEVIYNEREHMKNILSYFDFVKLCQAIKYFPQLNSDFWKEDITLPLSPSLRAIE